ncbi:ATP-binding cassette domain-containing protein [Candidatus Pelagibacter sp. HIMB1321]|uniref:ATP-binding cassette domain-containing protein n=1 Tax=Candidatus Pelagibacter sp. HIMB1321 TaxID=1388755 RepID=UPI000A07E431|nr:ABC transporter ATP-binding protein [Candidatus Pelagibacter sp. HIMB1321]SMF79554.1 ABC transporter transmembrane region [Candidatus Pelagibacter sp. HIMB1321]
MHSINKLYKILPNNIKSQLYIFIVLLLVATFFELISLTFLIPIAEIIISGETSFDLINDFLDYAEKYFIKNQILLATIIFVVVLFFLKTLYLIAFSYWTNKFSQNIYKVLSEQLLEKYLNNNYLFFVNQKSSDLIRNIVFETKNLSQMTFCYLKIFVELFIFTTIAILILVIDFKTSFILICFFFIFTSIYYFFTKKLVYNFGTVRQKSSARILKNLQEIFGTIKDIKLKKSEFFFKDIFSFNIRSFVKSAYKSNTIQEAPRFLIELFFIVILTIIIISNFSETKEIQSVVPLLVVYLAAGLRLLPGFVKLNSYLQQVESFKPSLNLISNELIQKNLVSRNKKENDNNIDIYNGNIICKNLNFSYGKNEIFKSLNFKIHKNSIFGICGESGSGKSTLVNILLGLLTPDKGNVYSNNFDIHKNVLKWQKFLGYVSQNIFLLDASLKENIAFGEESISNEKLSMALENANLLKFVENLPEGKDTNIGERGSKISGGQMQRIAIARELYRNPSVLVLDEATTGLDYENEKKIFQTIKNLKSRMTIIVVSHNKKIIEMCDNLIDLNKKF